MRDFGFTLVEMLIAMAIAVIILLISTQLMQNTNSVSRNTIGLSTGVRNIQNSANVIADDVRRAYKIAIPASLVFAGYSSTAYSAGSIEMLAPVEETGICFGATPSYKYEYVAYYFADRSSVAGQTDE